MLLQIQEGKGVDRELAELVALTGFSLPELSHLYEHHVHLIISPLQALPPGCVITQLCPLPPLWLPLAVAGCSISRLMGQPC